MYSYWLKDSNKKNYPSLNENIETDILIIGGGINGISIAFELSKLNYAITVVEQNELYHATTGSTTSKITFQHGYIYDYLIKNQGLDYAKLYFQGNLLAVKHIEQIIKQYDIKCDYFKCSHSLYAKSTIDKLINEKKAYDTLKISYNYYKHNDYAFLKVDNQAVFHVVKYLDTLLNIMESNDNIKIYENTRIIKTEINKKARIAYCENNKKIKANIIIFASSYPVYKSFNMFFLKLKPVISFVGEGFIKKDLKEAFITEDLPSFSLRPLNENKVLFAGFSNNASSLKTYDDIKKLKFEAFTQWGISSTENVWFNQDYQTLDKIPYIGKIKDNVYISTGFNKWGITNSILASLIIKDLIINNDSKYNQLFSLKRNIDFFKYLTYCFKNLSIFIKSKIFYRKNTCSHLHCGLRKNPLSDSFDCPCHGSRFDKHGNPIIGPATKKIKVKK